MAAIRLTSVLLAAIVGFSGWPAPALAQHVESPFAAAIRINASRVLDPRFDRSNDEWRRLRRLVPGRDITLTRRGSAAASRLFLSVNDAGITVLNLTDPGLPPVAARALRQIASQHADYFAAAATGATFSIDGMQLTSAGLSIKGNAIGDLRRVVEPIGRDDVVEISVRRRGRGFWGHLGPLGGYFVGAMAGGVTVGKTCEALRGSDRCDSGAVLGGSFFGGVAGAAYGFIAARRVSDEIVYQMLP